MRVERIYKENLWNRVVNCARTTVNKKSIDKEPTSSWKYKILVSEHSPIRQLEFHFKWNDLKSWVSVHLVRHNIGINHYVRTQRTDRTGTNRDSLPQDSKVEHEISINAQEMINISKVRLCSKASLETTEAWKELLETIKEDEPELYKVCVKQCVYRGFCPEFKSCGYDKTESFKKDLNNYRL